MKKNKMKDCLRFWKADKSTKLMKGIDVKLLLTFLTHIALEQPRRFRHYINNAKVNARGAYILNVQNVIK